METTMQITVRKNKNSRINEVNFSNLGFGNEVTDHMFIAEYKHGSWNDPRIIPFGNLSMAPTALALHYGQTVFEGMKAFRMNNGKTSIFRMEKHHSRFNRSLQRMCMPEVPYELFSESIKILVDTDNAWLKKTKGTSLYIRPFEIATEERFGVKVSDEYKYIVFTCAVGDYYDRPLRVKIEDTYNRAFKGGTGTAKCGGNYGGSMYPAHLAKLQGFDQVIWTDGSEELNIEESGTMNIIFLIDGIVATPPLSETILDGVTRDSFLTLAKDLGYEIAERKISTYELADKLGKGKVQEAFGAGTAAVATSISCINIKGIDYPLPGINDHSFVKKASGLLNEIRLGIKPDIYGWNTVL
jgi:branched-chain amino acid aminotransferase